MSFEVRLRYRAFSRLLIERGLGLNIGWCIGRKSASAVGLRDSWLALTDSCILSQEMGRTSRILCESLRA